MNQDMNDSVADEHPLDVDLVALVDGELTGAELALVAEHVQNCERCQSLAGIIDDSPRQLHMEHLPEIPAALAAIFMTEPQRDPEPDDLWHVQWEDAAMFVAVLGRAEDRFTVLPVTFEADPGRTVVEIPAFESPVGAKLAVWTDVERSIPLGVFNRFAGKLPADLLDAHRDPERATDRSWAAAHALADVLFAAIDLEVAQWLPEQQDQPSASLAELIRERGLMAAEVAEAAGLPPGALLSLLREQREATPDEASRLASVLSVPVAAIRRTLSIPRALATAIERPVHRSKIRARAAASVVSEAAARRELAGAVMASPARTTTAERDVEAWDELVRHQLDD